MKAPHHTSNPTRPCSVAYIGLGGNLGDPSATFAEALTALVREWPVRVTACSGLYRTAPLGGPPGQPDYLNAVVQVQTSLRPAQLLSVLLNLEQRHHRRRALRWGPRTLDLDLLMYDDEVTAEPGLTLPHPRLRERRFVLAPLSELAPDLVPPQCRSTVQALLEHLPAGDQPIHRIAGPGWIE